MALFIGFLVLFLIFSLDGMNGGTNVTGMEMDGYGYEKSDGIDGMITRGIVLDDSVMYC